jgi:SAM-dependent methyltransferase
MSATADDACIAFWATQTSSMHRGDDPQIYQKKAIEFAAVLRPEDREAGLVDLGCGAGELLQHFQHLVRISTAFDVSESMLAAARSRLGDSGIELIHGSDVIAFLGTAPSSVWTTTGAVNQFLAPNLQRRLLDLFAAHPRAMRYYMFDCVDPLRYALMAHGISYRPTHLGRVGNLATRAKRTLRRLRLAGRLAVGGQRDSQHLGSTAMGWGQLPRFWIREAMSRRLGIEIVSSKYYEYRYHVVLEKPDVEHR